jgi:predicted TIM-barrel fold metal-dependent hydrolase
MRVIALEEHFTTALHNEKTKNRPRQVWKDRGAQLGHDVETELFDLGERRLAAMDAGGIDVQVLSLNQPGGQGFEADVSVPMCREANDLLHAAVKTHPARFAGFAALPTADPAAAVKEFERAVTTLGFCGAMVNGHTRGSFLDERKYWCIFECAQALDVPIYLHPSAPLPQLTQSYFAGMEDMSAAAWSFAIDASCHFLRLIFAGVFDTFPRVKIILGHMGEGLPFGMHRLAEHTIYFAERRGLKRPPLQCIQENLAITTSGAFSVPALLCSIMTIGADKIMFSVDWPYESNKVGTEFLKGLPVSEDHREKIAGRNAERLLKLGA